MADVNFNSKVKTDGITREEFLAKFNDTAMKEKAGSIFDKFNKDNTGESADKLDVQEQTGLLAFMKNLAGADTKIEDAEFTAKAEFAKTFGFENKETLSSVATAFNALATGDDVTFGSDGKTVTVGGKTYTYDDNAALQSVTTANGDTASTRRNKQKYDPVHLSSNWRMQRDIGNKIASGDGDYAGVKNMTSAEEVLNKILEKKGITIDDSNKKTTLLKTFIKFNPSVFDRETGAVWLDADWTKLDFPVETSVDSMISTDDDLSGVGENIKASSSADATSKDTKAATAANVSLQKGDDSITLSSGDTTYASIYESSGWFSGDAYLSISSGKYKGKYKFVDKSDDNLNYGKFSITSVNGGSPRISVGSNKIKYLKGTDENGIERKFEVETDSNGYMTVKVDGTKIPLEDFMKAGR